MMPVDGVVGAPIQRIKWAVYTLLLINFVIYIVQDAQSAPFTVPEQAALLDWARAYVTSVDLAAWFILIASFELETYVLSDRVWTRAVRWSVQGVRLLCYVVILHTTVADTILLREFYTAERLEDAPTLCDYTGDDWSFLRNREYTYIDEGNCANLSVGSAHFAIGGDPVISDAAGLQEGRILAWTDLVENVAWLLIVLINEVVVRNYERLAGNGFSRAANRLKAGLYMAIVCIAFYWLSKHQVLYFYDEMLWVCGFLAIERNLHEWRAELFRTRMA
jgi:hypothetical protein